MPLNPPLKSASPNARHEPIPSSVPTTDYKNFREEQYEPLGGLWDESASLVDNFKFIAKEAVLIPYIDIQLPVIAAYSFIPSAMASVVPLLYIQGDSGSGKSTLTDLISRIHNAEIRSAAATFAGLRNEFNKLRWADPENFDGEQNTCLLFDNINRDTLLNENLYTFFLNGYNRKTDTISISKGGGENINFKVFGIKVLSSIHPFYTQSKFSELARRCIVIKCKPYEKMNQIEKQSCGIDENYSIAERLELENLDLSILNKEFNKFWNTESNLLNYVDAKRQLLSRRKKFAIPDSIDSAKWTISIDLLATGVTTGVWRNIPSAVTALGDYWQWHKLNIASSFGATHKILKDFIADETINIDKVNNELKYEAIPKEIPTEKLKKHLGWASSQGMLDMNPTPTAIVEVMADLGWRLDKGSKSQICWVQALN